LRSYAALWLGFAAKIAGCPIQAFVWLEWGS